MGLQVVLEDGSGHCQRHPERSIVKLNIFAIPKRDVGKLRAKLKAVGLLLVAQVAQDGWHGDFYFSSDAQGREVPWAKPLRALFGGRQDPRSHSPHAVYLFSRSGRHFAVSYGKSHFFIRPYCDYDFGIELAKRIADSDDTRLTASRKFGGRQRKSIRSFSSYTHLSVGSGESVDYIQAAIRSEKAETYGSTARFGTSAQLTLSISADEVGHVLSLVVEELGKTAEFSLPRTLVLSDEAEIERLDEQLLDQLQGGVGTTEFSHNAYDLYGVDFVFGSSGTYMIKCGRASEQVQQLTIRELKQFIVANAISRDRILSIKIVRHEDDGPSYSQDLKQALDFIADDERVILTGGRWMRFNQDYLDYLDDYLRAIKVEPTEPDLAETYLPEGEFNTSPLVANAGYVVADKDFSIFKTRSPTPVEAWDLQRGSTVYAVKFGTAQKLGYVCDQAMAVLELLRNKAEARQVPNFLEYCLWLGYRGKKLPNSIADTGSIILKQKIEAWARKAEDLGVVPVLKLSRRLRHGVDDSDDLDP